jgi:hypothetical protein
VGEVITGPEVRMLIVSSVENYHCEFDRGWRIHIVNCWSHIPVLAIRLGGPVENEEGAH